MLKCPSCPRVDADMGTCGSRLSCPMLNGASPVEVKQGAYVLLHCDPCELTRALKTVALLHANGSALTRLDFVCPRGEDHCQCHAVAIPEDSPSDPLDSHRSHKRAGPKGTAV